MKVRAPFRYWGSKVRMAPWIIANLPEHSHYVEVCAGSAAVMAVKEPVDAETLNDTYGEVVNFFRVLQSKKKSRKLIDRVSVTPYAHKEFRHAMKLLEHEGADDVDRAWAFLVTMQMAVVPGRTGWSYGVRGPSARKANKPGRWSTMPELMQLCVERFARVQITDWTAVDLMTRLDAPGALFFVDPPYLDESRPLSAGKASGYVEDAFDHDEFIEKMLHLKHATVAITHYPHERYDSLDWDDIMDYESHRNIPNGEGRGVKVERLYIRGAR